MIKSGYVKLVAGAEALLYLSAMIYIFFKKCSVAVEIFVVVSHILCPQAEILVVAKFLLKI